MAFEIIALDMDGTLLDSRKRVLPSSVAAVERAAAAGKTVAICSGRCPVMVTKYRDELPGVRYAICCAGAMIYDMEHDRVVDETDLDPAFISHALDVAEEEGFFLLEVTSGTGIYMQADEISQAARCGVGVYEQLYHETSTVIADAHAFARRPDVPQSKLNFHFADVAARDRCRARLEGSGVVITNCERSSMEFSAPGIDKGVGLARLAASRPPSRWETPRTTWPCCARRALAWPWETRCPVPWRPPTSRLPTTTTTAWPRRSSATCSHRDQRGRVSLVPDQTNPSPLAPSWRHH